MARRGHEGFASARGGASQAPARRIRAAAARSGRRRRARRLRPAAQGGTAGPMALGASSPHAAAGQNAAATLSNVVIAFETEEQASRRLEAFGYPPEIAAEIAVYLAQSSDLPFFVDEIAGALRRDGIAAEFVALDDLPARLRELAPRRHRTIVWALTDGVRFYRGSSVPALARLEGFARF